MREMYFICYIARFKMLFMIIHTKKWNEFLEIKASYERNEKNFICKKLGNRVTTEFTGDYDDYAINAT